MVFCGLLCLNSLILSPSKPFCATFSNTCNRQSAKNTKTFFMFMQSKKPNGQGSGYFAAAVRPGNGKRGVSLAAMVEMGAGDSAAAVRQRSRQEAPVSAVRQRSRQEEPVSAVRQAAAAAAVRQEAAAAAARQEAAGAAVRQEVTATGVRQEAAGASVRQEAAAAAVRQEAEAAAVRQETAAAPPVTRRLPRKPGWQPACISTTGDMATLCLRYTHKTSGCKTSGFKTSGFKTSGFKTSGLQNVRLTKRQVSKRLVSNRPVFKFYILIKQKV
jgi:hypothetical protein